MSNDKNIMKGCGTVPSLATYEKRVYMVKEIQDILGISRNLAYQLIKQKCFRCVKVGCHYRISKKSFDEWLDSIQEVQEDE
jgi:excisionase family DNA binding protein